MIYIRNIVDLMTNPILDILMFFVGLTVSSLISTLLQLILVKPFKCKMNYVEVFGFRYVRLDTGKWEYRGHRVKAGFQAETLIDLKAFPEGNYGAAMAYENGLIVTTMVLHMIISIVIFAVCLHGGYFIGPEFLAAIVFLTGLWTLICAGVRSGVAIAVLVKSNSKNTLGGYSVRARNMLRSNIPFENMDLKSVRELNFPKVWDSEKITYFPLYFAYLEATGKTELMPEAVNDIEAVLKPLDRSAPALITMFYLVYYYSYYNMVPAKAKEYYHRIGDNISKDMDSDSMCVKGFYELNCFGNVEKAKEFAASAVAKLDDMKSPSEREYWKKNIAKLNNSINYFRG